MSDETVVADKSEQESEVKDSLFAYDHDADEEVSEQQDTSQEQAETETPIEQDSPEDAETEQSAEVEDSEATEVEQADSRDEEKSPKEDPEAFQYYQSRYDKVHEKLGRKPEEISDEEAELVRTFLDHPKYLQDYSEFLANQGKGQPEQADSPQEEGPKTLERPKKPEEPVGYDHYEALSDPESDSFKYRLAKEEYLENLAEYAEKKADSTREEVTEKEKRREQQTKQKQVQAQWYNHLTQKEGFTDDQFKDFWQWKDKGQFKPQEIISMYKTVRGIDDTAERPTESEKRPSKTKSNQSKQKSPPSPATTAGAGNQREASKKKKGEEDQLFGYFG